MIRASVNQTNVSVSKQILRVILDCTEVSLVQTNNLPFNYVVEFTRNKCSSDNLLKLSYSFSVLLIQEITGPLN